MSQPISVQDTDALDKIGLPFNKAYETALEMYKSKNNKK